MQFEPDGNEEGRAVAAWGVEVIVNRAVEEGYARYLEKAIQNFLAREFTRAYTSELKFYLTKTTWDIGETAESLEGQWSLGEEPPAPFIDSIAKNYVKVIPIEIDFTNPTDQDRSFASNHRIPSGICRPVSSLSVSQTDFARFAAAKAEKSRVASAVESQLSRTRTSSKLRSSVVQNLPLATNTFNKSKQKLQVPARLRAFLRYEPEEKVHFKPSGIIKLKLPDEIVVKNEELNPKAIDEKVEQFRRLKSGPLKSPIESASTIRKRPESATPPPPIQPLKDKNPPKTSYDLEGKEMVIKPLKDDAYVKDNFTEVNITKRNAKSVLPGYASRDLTSECSHTGDDRCN